MSHSTLGFLEPTVCDATTPAFKEIMSALNSPLECTIALASDQRNDFDLETHVVRYNGFLQRWESTMIVRQTL
jgi:hypothetical protein